MWAGYGLSPAASPPGPRRGSRFLASTAHPLALSADVGRLELSIVPLPYLECYLNSRYRKKTGINPCRLPLWYVRGIGWLTCTASKSTSANTSSESRAANARVRTSSRHISVPALLSTPGRRVRGKNAEGTKHYVTPQVKNRRVLLKRDNATPFCRVFFRPPDDVDDSRRWVAAPSPTQKTTQVSASEALPESIQRVCRKNTAPIPRASH